jgi:hypothetical protein
MKTSTNLIKALDFIDVPGQWTQRVYARDKSGNEVNPNSKKAMCFCSLGIIERICNDGNESYNLSRAAYILYDSCIDTINDKAETQFDEKMTGMWLGAIFTALAEGD